MNSKGTQFLLTPAKARFHEGVREFKRQNYGQAFALFTEATHLDPDYADAFFHLGILYQHQNDTDLAARYFQMAIDSNPNHFGAKAQFALMEGTTPEISGSATALDDNEFFNRLREDDKDAAANLIDAIESTGLIPQAEIRGVLIARVFGILARGFILVVPALLGAFFVAGILDAMGLAPFLPTMVAAAILFVAIQVLVKQG